MPDLTFVDNRGIYAAGDVFRRYEQTFGVAIDLPSFLRKLEYVAFPLKPVHDSVISLVQGFLGMIKFLPIALIQALLRFTFAIDCKENLFRSIALRLSGKSGRRRHRNA